jgi:CheY-like chemotaxis protein
MIKDRIKRRILFASLLPSVAALLIFMVSGAQPSAHDNTILAVAIILLSLSLALYISLNKTVASLQGPQRNTGDHGDVATQKIQESPRSMAIQNIESGDVKPEAMPGSKPETLSDLRIPVNNIVGFTNLLLQTELSEKQAGYLDTIKNSSDVLLDLVNDIQDNARPEPGSTDREYGQLEVLAVDDNQLNLGLVCTLLEDLGISATAAHNGEEAIRYALNKDFDLILMDVQMPGMSGIEAMSRIRDIEDKGRRTPVIALTAHSLPDEVTRLLDAGMDDYVAKPISEKQLRAMLEKWTSPDEQEESIEATPGSGVVDWNLCLQLANNKQALAQELLAILNETLPDDQLTIKNALEINDAELLQKAVHRLKGAVKYCGVPGLHNAVAEVELVLQTPDQRKTRSALALLNREIDRYLDWWTRAANQIR